MSTENDVARSLRSWLLENRHEDADRILDVVFDQIPATPQRRAGWLARRFPTLSTYARFGLVAAALVLAAVIGIGIYGNSVGGPGPSQTPSPTPSLTPPPSETSLPHPIVGTWAAGETTCEQQIAELEATGFTTKQMVASRFDPTCANGIAAEGADFTIGSQFTVTFLSNGSLTVFEDGVVGWNAQYILGEDSIFEAADVNQPSICTEWRYTIDGNQLTFVMVNPGCSATDPRGIPISDQLAQTVIFQTSPFTRQP